MYILALSPKELEYVKKIYKVEEEEDMCIELPYKLVNTGFFQILVPDDKINKIKGKCIEKKGLNSRRLPHLNYLYHLIMAGHIQTLKIPHKRSYISVMVGGDILTEYCNKYKFPEIPDNCFFT